MTIEIALLISVISVGFSVYSIVTSKARDDRKDTENETEEKTEIHAILKTKLEQIEENSKDIKNDSRELRKEIRELRERVVAVEASMRSYHKRLDGMTGK